MYQFRALAVPDFMSRKAPPNYIAGLGRGATGFTTRSDVGPMREIDDGSALQAALSAAQGKGPRMEVQEYKDPNDESGLFNRAPYELDDEEADRIYEEVDRKMDERRRARREAREKQEMEQYHKERPRIQDQFADLKRGLAQMSSDDWANIPEVADMVRKRGAKKVKTDEVYERGEYVPDSAFLQTAAQSEFTTSIDTNESGFKTDFVQFGQARNKVLGLKLDQVKDSVSGQTNIDPQGFLTDLSSVAIKTDTEISDIKKARTLLKSVVQSNPTNPSGWISAARLEEVAGKLSAARDLISRGCEACPKSEDVWVEAARLNDPEKAKIILAHAVRNIPQSVKIWMHAKDLEKDSKAQKKVLRKALEAVPNSLVLWKAVVSAEEDPDDARILLSKAVECVPHAPELWLALARLETPENAQKILNRARMENKTSREIWLAAAKLMETLGDQRKVQRVIESAVRELTRLEAVGERDVWIKEAEQCEKENYLQVCASILKVNLGRNVSEEDYEDTWIEDADQCAKNGSLETARFIYEHAISVLPDESNIWVSGAFFEKERGSKEKLLAWLERATENCPQTEILWLMVAKELWIGGNTDAAKWKLQKALSINPTSEQIWLAAIKIEIETQNYPAAQKLLEDARSSANTERVWMKAAVLERILKNYDKALEILDRAIAQYPTFFKFWVIKGQILQDDLKKIDEAREHYASATKRLPKVSLLWVLASRLESTQSPAKARLLLERARILNPKNAELWREALRVEKLADNATMAKALLSKALQECPNSGELWCEMIMMETRPQRKARATDALKKCENNPLIVTLIGRLFWAERKLDKARNWLQRACKTNLDIGDSWAWWLKFEQSHGTQQQQEDVINACVQAEPKHGEYWQATAKDLSNTGKSIRELLLLLTSTFSNTIG